MAKTAMKAQIPGTLFEHKEKTMFFLLLLLLFSSCTIQTQTGGSLQRADDLPDATYIEHNPRSLLEREYSVRFDLLHVENLEVEVVKSFRERVVVAATEAMQKEIGIKNDGRTLLIHLKKEGFTHWKAGDVKITVYARHLNRIETASSGRIQLKDPIVTDRLNVEISGGGVFGDLEAGQLSMYVESMGSFQGRVLAERISVAARSFGKVLFSGRAKRVDAEVQSGGEVAGEQLVSGDAVLKAEGKGKIALTVSKSVQAEAVSKGEILVIAERGAAVSQEGNVRIERMRR